MVKNKDELAIKLRAFIELATNNFIIKAIVLFGSYSHGFPQSSSDIDVAVFSPEFGENPIEEMTALCRLRRKIDTDIEPLAFSEKDFNEHSQTDFVSEILNSGKIIYKDKVILI